MCVFIVLSPVGNMETTASRTRSPLPITTTPFHPHQPFHHPPIPPIHTQPLVYRYYNPFKKINPSLPYSCPSSALDRRTRIRPPRLDTGSPSLVVLLPPRLANILRVKTKSCRQDVYHPYFSKSLTNVCDLSMIIILTQPFCPMQETSGRLRRECRLAFKFD